MAAGRAEGVLRQPRVASGAVELWPSRNRGKRCLRHFSLSNHGSTASWPSNSGSSSSAGGRVGIIIFRCGVGRVGLGAAGLARVARRYHDDAVRGPSSGHQGAAPSCDTGIAGPASRPIKVKVPVWFFQDRLLSRMGGASFVHAWYFRDGEGVLRDVRQLKFTRLQLMSVPLSPAALIRRSHRPYTRGPSPTHFGELYYVYTHHCPARLQLPSRFIEPTHPSRHILETNHHPFHPRT